MILAGDVGGTNTRLALFETGTGSLSPLRSETFPSRKFEHLTAILELFLRSEDRRIEMACIGIAGPIRNGVCRTPNLGWVVDASLLEERFNIRVFQLINDLEANACAIGVLGADDFAVLNPGRPDPAGNLALIAAGTGLGEAVVRNEGGTFHPFATEGGHVDFAPRNPLEVGLLNHLAQTVGHVSYERILSGPGLVNIVQYLIEAGTGPEPAWLRQEIRNGNPAAEIVRAAQDHRSDVCAEALKMFVSVYGAEAGNLALKSLATGGLYLGGGIAPRIVQALREPEFLSAFFSKGRMSDLLKEVPVSVIMNDHAALLGAAEIAHRQISNPGR